MFSVASAIGGAALADIVGDVRGMAVPIGPRPSFSLWRPQSLPCASVFHFSAPLSPALTLSLPLLREDGQARL